jgi:hypothetical protein
LPWRCEIIDHGWRLQLVEAGRGLTRAGAIPVPGRHVASILRANMLQNRCGCSDGRSLALFLIVAADRHAE